MASKRQKAMERRAELAARRAQRAKIDEQIRNWQAKAITAPNRAKKLEIEAKIAALQYQKSQMPLRTR